MQKSGLMTQHTVESSSEMVIDLSEKSIRVLHVDDEPDFLRMAKQCLELQGSFQMDTASSVEEAFEKLKKKTYDAVVSDYQMPGKDGLEFLQELRQGGNCIPFIMFTGKGKEEVAVKAWRLGANHYVNKNGNPETVYYELAHCLRSAVEKHKTERQARETTQKLQAIHQSAVEGISYVDSEENFVYVNKAFADTLGCKEEEIVGVNLRRFVDEENWAKIKSETKRRREGHSSRYELTLRRIDGARRDVRISGSPLFNPDGEFAGTVSIVLDITERKKAEEALRESEEKFRSLVEETAVPIATTDLKGKLTYANKALAELLGYSTQELVGHPFKDFLHPKDKAKVMRLFLEAILLRRKPFNFEFRVLHKDGHILHLMSRPTRVIINNKAFGFVAVMIDITEQKKALDILREREEKFRTVAEQSPNIIFINKKGRIVYANRKAEQIMGYTREEFYSPGFNFLMLVAPSSRELVKSDFAKHMKGEDTPSFEYKIVTKQGRIIDAMLSSKLINYEGEKAILGTVTDITEQKKSEELLKESEERCRALFESIKDPVCIYVGKEGHLKDYNTAFKELLGYTDEELKDKVFLDFVHPDDQAMVLKKYQTKYPAQEFPLVYEIRVINRKRETVPVEISVSPYEKRGRVIGVEVVHREIIERKRYEERLSALNTYSRNLNMAESMKEIYSLTLDAMQKVLGFEYADFFMIEESVLRIVDQRGYPEPFPLELPLDGSKKGISIKAVKTGNSVIVQDVRNNIDFVEGLSNILSELAVPIKIGQKIFGVLNVESKKLDAFDEKDQALLEILASHAATAISNLERARELETYMREIQETKQKFEGLFLGNPEATVYLAPDFRIIDVNPRFEELFGNSLSEIKGRCIDDVIVPENMIDEAEMLDKKAIKGYVYHDTLRMRKDGSMVPVSVSAAPILIQGKLIGYIGVYKDISALKKTEHTMSIMNEKLRVVGSLTRHDARNKLSVITGNAYLLKKQLAGDSSAIDKLRGMEAAVEQTVKIFDFAKTYEMLGAEELVYVDVEKAANEAISLFSDLKEVKLVNYCHGLYVLADSLLRQLFYNLIDNSLKYGQKTTTIRVSFEKTDQHQLKLLFEDDGVGILATNKPQLFKEGYTTGGSTGYGLYLIKKMIEVYGWTIEEIGEPGKGARFVFAIPHWNSNGKENYRFR